MSAENISYDLKRFAGIKRDYTPEEVERLRGLLTFLLLLEYNLSLFLQIFLSHMRYFLRSFLVSCAVK